MPSLFKISRGVMGILEANISPREVAAGVCLGMFLGMIPLNGPMALLLAVFFFSFRINRVATLITLPLFKLVYLSGMSGLAEGAGYWMLTGIPALAGFWRAVTHLPVVAYLDINNTLVVGGMALASLMAAPVYFISKHAASALQAKYAEKVKGTKLGKVASGINSVVGLKKKSSGILGRIKVVKIAAVVVVLFALNFGIGAYLSPAATSFIVEQVNKYTPAKVSIGKASVWPLTMSCTLEDLKVFDPEDRAMRIAKIDKASVRISLIGLLSKRLVFSKIHAAGGEINIEGSADGSFNVMRLGTKEPGKAAAADSVWRLVSEKKDLFGKVYGMIKKHFSAKSQEKAKAARESAKKVSTTTAELPRGRFVEFKSAKDNYVFEIRDLTIDDAVIGLTYEGDKIDIKDSRLRLGRGAYDPDNGMRLDLFELKGDVVKSGVPAGSCDIMFSRSFDKNGQNATAGVMLKDIDLAAVSFIYADSLPVDVVRGRLTLGSRTRIEGDRIDSRNDINLTQHTLQPKAGSAQMIGVVPVASVVDALNSIDPVKMRFDITGTVEKPEFGGFQESLLDLVKPYLANVTKKLQEEGVKALGSFLDKAFKKTGGEQ